MLHFYPSPCLLPSFFFLICRFVLRSVSLLRALTLRSSSSILLRLSLPLLQQHGLARRQRRSLSIVNALQPVSEARAAEGVDGVSPEGGLVEERAHLDADLPEAHGEA